MICKYCGKEFKQKHKNQKFCSTKCRDESHKPHRIIKAKECVICGKRFIPSYRNSICCSPECKRKRQLQLQKQQNKRHCIICYSSFVPKSHNQVCCCSICKQEHERMKQIEKRNEKKKKSNIITIEQVARFQAKHREQTGIWLSYTECCKILEEQRGK